MNYNLLDEEWIPVLYQNGQYKRHGIRKVLENAGQIRQIAASNPMDRVAILRFLLALLYWCKGNPPEGEGMKQGDSFPADWFSKLDENRDCFNLLGNGKRFYQGPKAQRSRAITDLLQEIPTGNNFWHFKHSSDEKDGLCLSCCAMGLLRLPLFSVSGLPDLKSGINGVPPIYAIPLGKTLKETLDVNWVLYPTLGTPAWVQPDIRPVDDNDVPMLTGLTVLSRRVWLHELSEPALCIGCGTITPLVRTCEFQSVGRLENNRWNDPHVVYSDASPKKSIKASDLTEAGKFRLDRPWMRLLERIAKQQKEKQTSFFIVGFATDNAKNVDVWERVINVPLVPDGMPLLLEQWQKEGKRLEFRSGRSKIAGMAMVAGIRPHVESKASARAGELLMGDDILWQQVAEEYRPMMEAVAGAMSPGFTTAAVWQRRQIAKVMPDMLPKVETQKKTTKERRNK